jgi:hypothetical protein
MAAEEKALAPPPIPSLAPLGELLSGLVKLPQQLVAEAVPGMQQQIKELPETVRMNAQFFVAQVREIPETLSKQSTELMKGGFPVKTTAQAMSPLPLLSREDIARIQHGSTAGQQK